MRKTKEKLIAVKAKKATNDKFTFLGVASALITMHGHILACLAVLWVPLIRPGHEGVEARPWQARSLGPVEAVHQLEERALSDTP